MKKCIACAEQIQQEAKLCKHCGTLQNDPRFAQPKAAPAKTVALKKTPVVEEVISNPNGYPICTKCNKYPLSTQYADTCDNCRSGELVGDLGLKPASTPEEIAELDSAAETFDEYRPASGMSVAALIVSLFVPLVGLILGYVAQSEIRASKGRVGGQNLATAAIVIGWIWLVIGIFWIAAAASAAQQIYNYDY